MHTNPHSRRTFFLALIFFSLVISFPMDTNYVQANQTALPNHPVETTNSPTGWGDDGKFEVAVEWINHFLNPAGNARYWDDSCNGLYNFMVGAGWQPGFVFAEDNVWEIDAKNESLNGMEDTYIDSVDMAMICTHGIHGVVDNLYPNKPTGIEYSSYHNDLFLTPGEAYMAFGDKDLEFLAFDSCDVLDDNSFIYWAASLNGLHLLLGFLNNMHPDPYGDGLLWGYFMTIGGPYTVKQAWFKAIDYNQPSDTCARIIGEQQNNFNEYWWNTSPDPIVNSEKWISDHCSHGYIYGLNSNQQLDITSMPILQVQNRLVNKDYVLDTIAPAFTMTGSISQDDWFYSMTDSSGGITRTLLIDKTTGSYSFHNMSKLWTTPIVTPTLPSDRESAYIITEWINTTRAEGLPAVTYRNPDNYLYDQEGIYNLILSGTAGGKLSGQTTINIPTNVSMTYPRTITTQAVSTSSVQQVDFPIFGAGARMVVYLGDQGEIIGAQGGSRDVHVMSDFVEILDPTLVWSMFLKNPGLAIGDIPIEADTITYTVSTLGYYEMPYFTHQDELIPVWEFRSIFYLDGSLVASDWPIYLPAAAYYLPPTVAITSPVEGDTFLAGQPVSFTGTITGGTPPFTLEWSAEWDGYLGNTPTIIHPLTSMFKGVGPSIQHVTLQVTDANGLTSTDTISLTIKPILLLPIIKK